MKQSTFLDKLPFIYIFPGVFTYLIFLILTSQNLETKAIKLYLCNTDPAKPILCADKLTTAEISLSASSPPLITSESLFLNRYPAVLHFFMFFATLGAFTGAIFIPALLAIRKLFHDYKLSQISLWKRWEILMFGILIVVYWKTAWPSNAIVWRSNDEILFKLGLLFEKPYIHNLLTTFIYLTGVLCMVGLFVLVLAILRRNELNYDNPEIETPLQKELTWYFQFFSFCLSCIIAGGVLSSVFLRDVVYEIIIPASDNVRKSSEWKALSPIPFMVHYCLNFTVILIAILNPIYNLLKRSGQMALARVRYKNPTAGSELMEFIGYKAFSTRLIRLWILILTPILTLILAVFIKFLERILDY